MYIVYIRGRHYFPLVCTFKKDIKNVEVKVIVQKGPLGFRGNLTVDVLIPSTSRFHSLLSYGNSS